MTTIKTLLTTSILIILCGGAMHASATAQVGESNNEMGAILLFIAGLIGLFMTRKHIKSKAS